MTEHLAPFSAPVRRWFAETFDAPTPPQVQGWPVIAAGENALICAPTGSGKTLAAFLFCLDEIFCALQKDSAPPGIHTLYISPLKALNYDIERNLDGPLAGVREAARALGEPAPVVRVAVRTGDTKPSQRAAMLRKPPHLLITTPESLFILLTSPRAIPLLSTLRYIVVDEVHALLGNKRGVNLALALERLVALSGGAAPVRVGLSATLRPLEEAARFLGGYRSSRRGNEPRPVTVVDTGGRKELDLKVVVPTPDLAHLSADSIWPEVHALLLDWIREHRSTLAFVRMRAQSERISRALNELAGQDLASAHHGSLSHAVRKELEERLKSGRLPALLSTGTLELGIDVGAIDLVVQVGSPGSVSKGLQRVGRAGHLLTKRSRGRVLPLFREDLVESAVVARRMLDGQIEATRMPRNALDVLAQHVVSAAAIRATTGAELLELFRRAAPYRELTREALDTVLALLSGRYPADVARGLSAKVVWERSTDSVTALPGAGRLAVTTGGTIPDRGYYKLQLADGTRLGELEEEFVFERVVGDVIAFGSSSWRISSIDRQGVVVSPAPGVPAVIPFWKGGLFGRDPELSMAIGAFRGELYRRADRPADAQAWLQDHYPVDERGARNLVQYMADQRRRDVQVGTDRQVVVEVFQDDLEDHNLLIHSCFGNRINAPWAMALRSRLRERLRIDPQVISDDNGILFRVPAGEEPPPLDILSLVEADELTALVTDELARSAMYGSLFRQNAARFLVLGNYGVHRRTPLWLQRLRAKDLQEATAEHADFPVRMETFRECMHEMMELPLLRRLLGDLATGAVQIVTQETGRPSPVASGLLNRFIGQYMYEYDEPRAERVLGRLQLDLSLLDQLLERQDVSDLLMPEAMEELVGQWQGRTERTRARTPDELLSTVLRLAVVAEADMSLHCDGDPAAQVEPLLDDGRLSRFRSEDGDDWLCATEDLPLLARAHEPGAITCDPERPLDLPDLSPDECGRLIIARLIDHLGPVTEEELRRRAGLPAARVGQAVAALLDQGRLRRGRFRSDRDEEELCTPLNLRQIRRRSLTHARRQVEPVEPRTLQQFVLEHQHLGGARMQGSAALVQVMEQLSLRPLHAAILERHLLGCRIQDYQPAWLDELVTRGDLLWTGWGKGKVCFTAREDLDVFSERNPPGDEEPRGVEQTLSTRGASFIGELLAGAPAGEVKRALWELVWAGRVTNDRIQSLRQGLLTGFEPPKVPRAREVINPFTGRRSTFSGRRPGRRRPVRADSGGPWAGRWSLLPRRAPRSPAEIAEATIWLVLRRYGLVARELVSLEPGLTWSGLYPLLCQLELCGELRRGLFVSGLSAAQFAPARTVDRLRALRDRPGEPLLINSCDPAFIAPAIYLPLPGPLARRPSCSVVVQGGDVALVAEARGKRLHFDPNAAAARIRGWLGLLPELLARGERAVRVEEINGEAVLESAFRPDLERLGFTVDDKALELRRF